MRSDVPGATAPVPGDIRDADILIRDRISCPACGGNWQGNQIPEEYRQDGYYGPPETAPTHYSLLVGYEHAYDHPDRYDGVSLWLCPHCRASWDRWTGVKTTLVWDDERGLLQP